MVQERPSFHCPYLQRRPNLPLRSVRSQVKMDRPASRALGPEFILPDIAQLPGLIRSINSPEAEFR